MKKVLAILVILLLTMTVLTACKKEEPPKTDNNQNNNQEDTDQNTVTVNRIEITVDTDREIGDVKITYASDMNNDNDKNNNSNDNNAADNNTGNENKDGGNDSAADDDKAGTVRGDVLEYTVDTNAGANGFTVTVYDTAGEEIASKMFTAMELTEMEETVRLHIRDKETGDGVEIIESSQANDSQNNNQNGNADNKNKAA